MRNKYARVPDPADFKSPEGDLFQVVYTSYYKPDGTIGLRESDRIDIKKEINSHRDETDMSFVLSRLMVGDDSVLNPRPPMFGDFTNLPTSYAEMLNLVLAGEQYFDSLPLDTKKQFDNDRGKWFASIGTEAWLKAMGFVQASTPDTPVIDSPAIPITPDFTKEKDVI